MEWGNGREGEERQAGLDPSGGLGPEAGPKPGCCACYPDIEAASRDLGV